MLYEDAYHALYWESPRVRDVLIEDVTSWLRVRITAKGVDGDGATVRCDERVLRSKEFLAGVHV